LIDRWPTSAEALPFGTSAVAQIQQLAREVFENAFVLAMHPTAVVAILVLLVAATTCVLVVRQRAVTRTVEPLLAAAD